MAHHLNYGDEKCKAPGRLVVTFIWCYSYSSFRLWQFYVYVYVEEV